MPDIVVIIRFSFKEPGKTEIFTNARREALPEILSNWLRSQIGAGEDTRKASGADLYEIRIELDLATDIFVTTSNTHNLSLLAGIVGEVFRCLNSVVVKPLAELVS